MPWHTKKPEDIAGRAGDIANREGELMAQDVSGCSTMDECFKRAVTNFADLLYPGIHDELSWQSVPDPCDL